MTPKLLVTRKKMLLLVYTVVIHTITYVIACLNTVTDPLNNEDYCFKIDQNDTEHCPLAPYHDIINRIVTTDKFGIHFRQHFLL